MADADTQPTGPPTVFRTARDRVDEFFANQRDGQALEDLADAIGEVTRAVLAHGKPGKVQLTLTLAPLKNVPGAMRVADAVTKKVPAEPKSESIFYGDTDGDLSRSDPRQRTLDGMPGHSSVGVDPTFGLQRVDR